MLEHFDIQSAAREILSAGRIVEADADTLDTGVFDAEGSNALINGNIAADAVVKGAKSLLVQGSLLGEAKRLCRIQMGGEVVVSGEVKYAQIAAHSIRIGAGAKRCRLAAQADIWVGSDLADARMVVGEFASAKRKIEKLKQKAWYTTKKEKTCAEW